MSIGWVHNIQTAHGKWAASLMSSWNRPSGGGVRQHFVILSRKMRSSATAGQRKEKVRARFNIATPEGAHLLAPRARHDSCGCKNVWRFMKQAWVVFCPVGYISVSTPPTFTNPPIAAFIPIDLWLKVLIKNILKSITVCAYKEKYFTDLFILYAKPENIIQTQK